MSATNPEAANASPAPEPPRVEQSSNEERALPFLGMKSYQSEDADLFHGRERDTERLIARILSNRFTLLHAPSGAGKTSLLNAKVLPGLEALDWWPARMTPQQDPMLSTRNGTLAALLPPPVIERQALDRILRYREETTTLAELVLWYSDLEQLSIRERQEMGLLRAFEEIKVHLGQGADRRRLDLGRTLPFLARVLRRSITVETFDGYLRAVARGTGDPVELPHLHPGTTLGELSEVLAHPRLDAGNRELLSELSGPTPGLWAFFEDLGTHFLERLPHASLVLVFDQFEELFTLFTDEEPGSELEDSEERPDAWRLRWEFFDELERLNRAQSEPGTLLPQIRYVISMREEWVARLGPIRDFAPNLALNAYYLDFLSRDDAREAVSEPAKIFGGSFEGTCVEQILDDLELEARFVQPAQLQIVCSKLWHVFETEGLARIDREVLKTLNGARGILHSFLEDVLAELPGHVGERLETLEGPPTAGAPTSSLSGIGARSVGEGLVLPSDLDIETLEMLDALFTTQGARRTRRILEEKELLEAPLRSRLWRSLVLEVLVDQYIVRRERRVSGNFVEITHEFLLYAIDREIRKRQRKRSAGLIDRQTLKDLERFGDTDFRSLGDSPIRADALRRLHDARDRFEWPDWASELMLRSVLFALPELGDQGPDLVRHWSERLNTRAPTPLAELLAPSSQSFARAPRRRTLSLEELRRINLQRADLELSTDQLERILRSYLWMGGEPDRLDIQYWTRRLEDHG